MNSTQIKCFHSLGKTHNFTQTAKELYLAQPTVSKNIHNLEKEIGIQLIFHDHRKICLTEEGKYFHEVLLKVAADIDNALQKIKKSEISKQRTISLGYSGLPFEKQFLPVFIQLMQQKRKWSVELKTISLSKSDFKN
ncbi:LysR family transcriptional regulator, partial [Lactobacillus sp. XV13L]|nr:LysR family transcriptional regulator [Lactobacillus sp. XV13L]